MKVFNVPQVFKVCDEDNKGYLSREDFKVAVVMLFGYKPSKVQLSFSVWGWGRHYEALMMNGS